MRRVKVLLALCIVLLTACSNDKRAPTLDDITAFIGQKKEFDLFSNELLRDLARNVVEVDNSVPQDEMHTVRYCQAVAGESLLLFQSVNIKILQAGLENALVELVAAHRAGTPPSSCKNAINGLLKIKSELKDESILLINGGAVSDYVARLVMTKWGDVEKLSADFPVKILNDIGVDGVYDRYANDGERLRAFKAETKKLYELSVTINKQFRKLVLADMKSDGNCYDAVQMGMLFRAVSCWIIVDGYKVANVLFAKRNKELPGMQDMIAGSLVDLSESLRSFEQIDTYLRTLQERQNYLGFLSAGRDFLESYAAWKKALMAVLEQEEVRLPAAAN